MRDLLLSPKPQTLCCPLTLATRCTPWQIKFCPVVYKMNRLHPVSLKNLNKVFLQRLKSWRISMSVILPTSLPCKCFPSFKNLGAHSWRHPYPHESLGRWGMTLNCPWVVPLCHSQHVALMTPAPTAESKEWKPDISPLHPTIHSRWTACIMVKSSQHENMCNGWQL